MKAKTERYEWRRTVGGVWVLVDVTTDLDNHRVAVCFSDLRQVARRTRNMRDFGMEINSVMRYW